MGFYDFCSDQAGEFWGRLNRILPFGRWQDVEFGQDAASTARNWWEEQSRAFIADSGLKDWKRVNRLSQQITEWISIAFDPGNADRMAVVKAIGSNVETIIKECYPRGLEKMDPVTLGFRDCAMTILKHLTSIAEHEARERSPARDHDDQIAKSLEPAHTVLLLRFKDTFDEQMFPVKLSLNRDDDPKTYFEIMIKSVDRAVPRWLDRGFTAKSRDGRNVTVTREILGENVDEVSKFLWDTVVPGGRRNLMETLGDTMRYISAMDTYVRSENDPDATDHMVAKRCVYLMSLADARRLGGRRGTDRHISDVVDAETLQRLREVIGETKEPLKGRGPVDPRGPGVHH
jgi:hypothetical protein